MSVYQIWQEDRDKAKEKLEEAEKHLRDCLKNAKGSPEPPTDEFRNRIRESSIQILDLIEKIG